MSEKTPEERLLPIGEMAKISGFSVSKLRYYDEIGVLKAAFIDYTTNYRYYKASQLYETNFIAGWTELGFTISEIKALKEKNGLSQISEHYELKEKDITNKIENLKRIKRRICEKRKVIETLLENDSNDLINHYTIEFSHKPVEYLITIKKKGPFALTYESFKQSKDEIIRLAEEFKIDVMDTIAYRSTILEYPKKNMFYSDLNFSIPCISKPERHYDFIEKSDESEIAKIMFYGSMDGFDFDKYYSEFEEKIKKHGYMPSGTTTMIYVVNSFIQPEKNKHITEINIPIKQL